MKRVRKTTAVRYSTATRRKAVKRVNDGATPGSVAKSMGCSENAVRYWVAADLKSRTTRSPSGLPMAKRRRERALPKRQPASSSLLIPAGYRCPHCNGLVELPSAEGVAA